MSGSWDALQWASPELKGDKEIVLKAVSQSWSALKWASDERRALSGTEAAILNEEWSDSDQQCAY